ncbi:MAG TPA: gluconate 2-dehydrogenase subunit 3 family protein [Acidimicrobiales bacterium]|nr:gluconate 2-dehydrogenase subunit 3 family protein [Acidimicrobiales bacterium]
MSGAGRATGGVTPGGEGRFDGYDVLGQQRHWDDATTKVVTARLRPSKKLEFFGEKEARTAGALFDDILGQHCEPKVPVLEMVDSRLAIGETDGWRYDDMPEDRTAWRETLAHLDADARESFGRDFSECTAEQRGSLVEGVREAEKWHGLPAGHVWSLWSRYACAAFYAHPWAWNEIGFGGPAYPRGYKVTRPGWHEPWEVGERDAKDPVPWAGKVETARRGHAARFGFASPSGEPEGKPGGEG